MKFTLALVISLSFLFLSISFVAFAETDSYTVIINVTDADRSPITNAVVEVDGQKDTTDTNGNVAFHLSSGKHTVDISGNGISKTDTIDVESNSTYSFILGSTAQENTDYILIVISGILIMIIVIAGVIYLRRRK